MNKQKNIEIKWGDLPKIQVNSYIILDAEAVVKELKENFTRKDTENLDKINSLKRDLSERKRDIINLKSYVRELIALLEEWGPKGIDIPSIKKYQHMDLTPEKGSEIVE